MIRHDLNDTIAAISTALGDSGIGIVRVSGKDALKIADQIFLSKDGHKPAEFKTYTTHYGWIVENQRIKNQNIEQPKEYIDEVILTVMRSPKSYTKEDVVEINCHGGIVALRRVLGLVLENGGRLAEPGEFTQRAFLNGRIDLVQAEAVLDVIRAKTDSALKIGQEQLRGNFSKEINQTREELLRLLSPIEASLDFPEEEISPPDLEKIDQRLKKINQRLTLMLGSAKQGRVLREGLHLVICGRPNVGKSSLLNALLKQERSIVSAVPGTTRDTIEEIIDLKGIPVRIVDTAGILEPRNLLEKKAVTRAKKQIELADLIILLFDGSRKFSRDDEILIKKLKNKATIAVINKIDLRQRIEKAKITRYFHKTIEISARRNRNINLLEEAVVSLVYNGKIKINESVIVSNLRHIEAITQAQKLVARGIDSLDNKLSLDLVAQDLKDALSDLDQILGKQFSQDLLEKIFSEFCIGK